MINREKQRKRGDEKMHANIRLIVLNLPLFALRKISHDEFGNRMILSESLRYLDVGT